MQSDVGWEHWVSFGDVGIDPFTARASRVLQRTTSAPQARRQRTGPRSLVELGLDAAARNAAGLTPAHLAQLPEKHIVALLTRLLHWGGRECSPMLSLAAWKLLAPPCMAAAAAAAAAGTATDAATDAAEGEGAVPGVGQGLPRHGQVFVAQIRSPRSPLAVYLDALRLRRPPTPTLATSFLAHVRILTHPEHEAFFRTNELLALATLPNLGVLEILDQTLDGVGNKGDAPRVDDRLLRGWSTMADAFPALSVLVLHQQRTGAFTLAALEYVTRFPALAYFSVSPSIVPQPRADGTAKPLSFAAVRDACRRLGWSGFQTTGRGGKPCYRLETTAPGDRDRSRKRPFAYEIPRPASADDAAPQRPPPAVRSWDEAAPKTKTPVLAAHWALRMHAFLVAADGGFRDDVLASCAYASEAVAYHMAEHTAEAYQPMVSLTLGEDTGSRAGGGIHDAPSRARVAGVLFVRGPGTAARVPETAFVLTSSAGANSGAGSMTGTGSGTGTGLPPAADSSTPSDAPPRLRKRKRSSIGALIGTFQR